MDRSNIINRQAVESTCEPCSTQDTLLGSIEQTNTKKKSMKMKRNTKLNKGKKPKDMPRRPLSAYNYFFQMERTRLLESSMNQKNPPTDSEEKTASADLDDAEVLVSGAGKKSDAMGFETMAKTIGQRWKSLPESEATKYRELAREDMERYRCEKDLYQLELSKRARLEREAAAATAAQRLLSSNPQRCTNAGQQQLESESTTMKQPSLHSSDPFIGSQDVTFLGTSTQLDRIPINSALNRNADNQGNQMLPTSEHSLTSHPMFSQHQGSQVIQDDQLNSFTSFAPLTLSDVSSTTLNNAYAQTKTQQSLLEQVQQLSLQQELIRQSLQQNRFSETTQSSYQSQQDNSMARPNESLGILQRKYIEIQALRQAEELVRHQRLNHLLQGQQQLDLSQMLMANQRLQQEPSHQLDLVNQSLTHLPRDNNNDHLLDLSSQALQTLGLNSATLVQQSLQQQLLYQQLLAISQQNSRNRNDESTNNTYSEKEKNNR